MNPSFAEDAAWKERLAQGELSGKSRQLFAEFALTRVSRTFALNIRVLPQPLRDHVLYAYLYCRMADTLEDDAHLERGDKARLLKRFSTLFNESHEDRANIERHMREFPEQLPVAWRFSAQWEHLLLVHAPVVLIPFLDFPKPATRVISRCLREMCSGMGDFASNPDMHPVKTIADLDRYCYYVAGTVGELLCELFIQHTGVREDRALQLRKLCVSFGLGLQLTNILKDLHDDRDRNVFWLPEDLLIAQGLTLQEFFSDSAADGRKAVYRTLFSKTQKHLEDALEYSCLIPRWDMKLRLFCLWPLFMAAETLALLAESVDALTQGVRLKIPRQTVKRIVRRTSLFGWSNGWIHREFAKPMQRLEMAAQHLAPSPILHKSPL
ncbi:MAG TPA: squalene synthase [Fibrobacteres bacterium]|jgi:farnesyl-diphosphate farnesyltransferase|nr:squalene synthase [Fibrobacterota bacterium]